MATQYVVLVQTGEDLWKEIGKADAGNDLAAIRAFLGKSDGEYGAGQYRAVPARSWPDEPHDLKPQIKFV